MKRGRKFTKEEYDKGRTTINQVRKQKYVESVKKIYNDLMTQLISNYTDEEIRSEITQNSKLIPYIMEKYGLAEQTAADYVGKAKTLYLVNLSTTDFAQKVIKKNYLRLEDMYEDETNTNTKLKIIELENKMFNQGKTLDIQTNPDGRVQFRINLGQDA